MDYVDSDDDVDFSYDVDDVDEIDDVEYDMEDDVLSDNEDDQNNEEYVDQTFTVLHEDQIRQRQNDDVLHVSSVLSLDESLSSVLLYNYNWNVSQLMEDWCGDSDKIQSKFGILTDNNNNNNNNKVKKDNPKRGKIICGICFEGFFSYEMCCSSCGHLYCMECWKEYVTVSINNDGPGCLSLRCPEPSCMVLVDGNLVNKLGITEEDKQKYGSFFLRSYVENSRNIKWCPAPGCENAVEVHTSITSNGFDVVCHCSNPFCWNCSEDAHRPVSCETVAKWVLKNTSEAENTEWLIANSKPCPKCRRPIEKNHGCMHMKCTPPCNFHFCWLCLGSWSDHGEKTGGFYVCNRYEEERKQGIHTEEQKRRREAKNSLMKYTHYYERFAANQKSREQAILKLNKMKSEDLSKLEKNVNVSEAELDFVLEAWEQIIECRRVLKWTYAYGYYLPEKDVRKKQFFECLQGEAEVALERLHNCAEKELMDDFLDDYYCNKGEAEFKVFKQKLANQTKVTCLFFENLIKALRNGLSEVESLAVEEDVSKNDDLFEDPDYWSCDQCTFANPISVTTCEICDFRRPDNVGVLEN